MKRTRSAASPGMSPGEGNEGYRTTNGQHGPPGESDAQCEVAIVGAGPAGLMLAANLVRFGIKTRILDDREDKTSTGRADGLQPKTIETFKQMRLADSLLRKGVRIYDISFWESTSKLPLRRTARQIHYPKHVDALDPFILLVHQGMIEDVLLQDLEEHNVRVERNSPFVSCFTKSQDDHPNVVTCRDTSTDTDKVVNARYVVGCDGAHSKVRQSLHNVVMEGESGHASWGVLDGVIDTDFPDLWSKVIVRSEIEGSILCIPRERNMTRLYIELNSGQKQRVDKDIAGQEYVMQKARDILKPFRLEWKSIEWFGNYHIGQRVANHFSTPHGAFIAGDAAHTQSPKAAQGMNVSMHDGLNLAWKLNLAVRGLATPSLLDTYEKERRKIALDLINFDTEHVKAFAAGDAALAKNFDDNISFISGAGAVYNENVLTEPAIFFQSEVRRAGGLYAGAILPPARVTRYIDANPVDLQLDIPMLGQFRVYFFLPEIHEPKDFLQRACSLISRPESFLQQLTKLAKASYAATPRTPAESDEFVQPQRYVPASPLFTFAVVTRSPQSMVELADLPPLLQDSRWTIYLDNLQGSQSCTEKYLGSISGPAIVTVRPDGYVGSIGDFSNGSKDASIRAVEWLERYFSGFLKA